MKVTLAELGPNWRKKFGACLLMRLPGVQCRRKAAIFTIVVYVLDGFALLEIFT
jgi:hypothetical protein